jgi:hypothetical protein
MTANHSKTLFIRYDVRFPKGHQASKNDNKVYRDFHANWIKNLKRQKLDPHYVWAAERSREKHLHYHGVLLMNGQRTKSPHNHLAKAEKLWANALGLPLEEAKGLIDHCDKKRDGSKQKNGIMLRKDDPKFQQKVDGCYKWGSYLAKENTKHAGMRTFSSSQIKSNSKKKGN